MSNRPRTLGELRESGYRVRSVKEEMRRNLIRALREGRNLFPGILGYEDTVIPQVQNAILSRHDMLFLGLRGQAKTRMLRLLVNLLDDAIPIVAGSETNDNPFQPISKEARDRVATEAEECPIEWIGRERRYNEKLATPDVTIADLIGEVDLIKHARGHELSSELVMHFGLIPRTNRGIFCMNELPDLSPKIQVGMFNVLEERDVQIRGFPVRLALDLCMVFSANPEDYTNRGRIVTPLKDRIGSVIKTHYPLSREIGIQIVEANAWADRDGDARTHVPQFMKEIVEETSRLARQSSRVNQQSGVSVRMSIANYENMISNAERRALLQKEPDVVPRVSDLTYIAASARGKLELTLSEDDGQEDKVVRRLLGEAVKNVFDAHFQVSGFRTAIEHFDEGNTFEVGDQVPSGRYLDQIGKVPGLKKQVIRFAQEACPDLANGPAREPLLASVSEFVLEALHVHNRLNKNEKPGVVSYGR
ncbi:MAG: magnesium chelatase [Planctomycetes bacterium]|nr:magnesium chelatase [Planctomycetota bacterium]